MTAARRTQDSHEHEPDKPFTGWTASANGVDFARTGFEATGVEHSSSPHT